MESVFYRLESSLYWLLRAARGVNLVCVNGEILAMGGMGRHGDQGAGSVLGGARGNALNQTWTLDALSNWDQRYIDAPVMVYRDTNTDAAVDQKLYVTQDADFNVTATISGDTGVVANRFIYTPYGQRTVLTATWTAGTTDFMLGHQGLYLDGESGLYYNRARYLHPTLGNFIQRDPLGYVDGGSLYQYERSRPGTLLDPSGKLVPIVVGGIVITVSSLEAAALATGVTASTCMMYPACRSEAIRLSAQAISSTVDAVSSGARWTGGRISGGYWPIGYGLYGAWAWATTTTSSVPCPTRTRARSDPYSYAPTNPGRDGNGNCKPCPPDGPIWTHIHEDGTTNSHQIPNTCECMSVRVNL